MFSFPHQRLAAASARVGVVFDGSDPVAAVAEMSDDAVMAALADIAEAHKALQVLAALVSAEVARRSDRAKGYDGLAQRRGHRTGADLVQSITGQTRNDVRRATRAGEDLIDSAAGVTGAAVSNSADREDPAWFAPLTDALRGGRLSREQYDVIRRGLGQPPHDRREDLDPMVVSALWREAAAALVDEAGDRGVEELAAAARLARDTMDPLGVRLRFDERFERRSLRMWIDDEGQHHARLVLDDDAAVWVRTILNAALRPRRGPRFVAVGESGAASGEDEEIEARRSNEQLQYDTLLAILRTGAAADPTQAFGDRQPGVRIVVPAAALGGRQRSEGEPTWSVPAGTAFAEETGQALPVTLAERYICDAGTRVVTNDHDGSPLDVGRDRRLFTPKQRVALALRDGGCRWCGAEPSRCEAHHIDEWHARNGRTDLADGVLLCRSCHMRLHHQRWRITRTRSAYLLHPPNGGAPRALPSRSLLRFDKISSHAPPAGGAMPAADIAGVVMRW